MRSRGRSARVGVGLGFLFTGIFSVLLGPILPDLRAGWSLSHSQAASLFVAQFTASSLGAVVASFHVRRSLVAGYGLIAAGLAGFAVLGWPLARAAVAVMGFGLGLVITASNLWTAHRNPERRGASLATLNLIWGLGAALCPLLFAAVRGRLAVEAALGLLAAPAAVGCAWLWLTLTREGPVATSRDDPADRATGLFLGLMATMFFVYVGVENAIGGWLVTVADQFVSERSVVSFLIASGFWGAVLAGRAGTPWILRRVTESALYRACLGLAVLGTLLLLWSDSGVVVAAGAMAAGLGLAPLFPLTVSILAGATASTRSRRAGWVLACSGLGGATLPWLAGRVMDASGALRHAFFVPLAGLILLAALHRAQRTLLAASPTTEIRP